MEKYLDLVNLRVIKEMVYDRASILQTMERSTEYTWSGATAIEKSTDAELFAVMYEESPVVKRIAFLVAKVVFVTKRNIIVWTDFPITQLFIEMCLKATGCLCESYHSGLSEVERKDLLTRFNSRKEAPFAMIMSTKLSAYGLNIQHNCADEIMSGTGFSDPQEGQALARIYRIGQTRSNRACKLVVENTSMQIRMNKRFHKVVPDLIAHMVQGDDIAKADAECLAEISNSDGADLVEKIQTVVERLWGEVEGVADVLLTLAWGGMCGFEYGSIL